MPSPRASLPASTLTSLNGLRGFAAIWVMLCHFAYLLQQAFGPHFTPLSTLHNGWVAVDFFFILSGFIIAHTYPQGCPTLPAYKTFLTRRIARLYPLHFLTFTAAFFLIGAAPWGQAPTSLDVLRHLTLTHTWWNYSHPIWNGVSWSISAEWAAYLLFPLLFATVRRIPTGKILPTLAAVMLGYMTITMLFANSHLQQVIASGLVRGIPCFAMGLLICRLRILPSQKTNTASLTTKAAIGIAIALPVIGATHLSPWLLIPFFGLLIFGLSHQQGPVHRLFSTRLFQQLGTLSYGIYLIHDLILKAAVKYTDIATATGPTALAWLTTLITVTLVLSWLAYHLVEAPCRNLTRPSTPSVYIPSYTLPKSIFRSTPAAPALLAIPIHTAQPSFRPEHLPAPPNILH